MCGVACQSKAISDRDCPSAHTALMHAMTPHPFLNRDWPDWVHGEPPVAPASSPPLSHLFITPSHCIGISESRLRRRFKGPGSLSRAKTGIMTSHFGIVVVDGNKRGEDEALTEEEKRQMYAPDAACVFRRSHG